MNVIQAKIKFLKVLKGALFAAFEKVLKDNKEQIIDFNLSQLYDDGQDGNGQMVKPYYTSFTVMIKSYKGQRTDHVTLKDTGEFYRSFNIRFSSSSFELFATDGLTDDLVAKYGKNIFGLNENSLKDLQELILDYLDLKSLFHD